MKYFIPFQEGNLESLKIAIGKAESLGFHEMTGCDGEALTFKGTGCLIFDPEYKEYFIGMTPIDNLNKYYYKHWSEYNVDVDSKYTEIKSEIDRLEKKINNLSFFLCTLCVLVYLILLII